MQLQRLTGLEIEKLAEEYNTLVEEVSARGTAVVQQAIAEGGSLIEILRRVFVRQCAVIEEDK